MGESKSEKGGHLPPFLLKCYNMVDDPISDSVISWSSSFDSFIIWDMTSFQTQLLPKYFKHNNFSSFWRQLNTYGFRKSDPDRWEFVHNGFIKGKKHLLKDISRRKQTEASSQEKEAKQNKVHCVEVGMFGLLEEVETLKRDRNLLMQELVKCRQQQHDGDRELHCLRQRIKGMEKSQQQMFSLLSMAMQNPGFLAQLIQQNRNNWRMADTKKKRRVPVLRQSKENGESEASDGQLVRYQPLTVEASEPLLEPISDSGSEQSDPSPSGVDDFFMDIDFMSFGEVTPFSTGTDSIPSETNGLYILPDLPEDDIMMDQLLSSSPDSCSSDEMELHNPQNQDNRMVLKSNNRETKMETYQNPELLTKQTEQLEFTETITIEE